MVLVKFNLISHVTCVISIVELMVTIYFRILKPAGYELVFLG